jgi:hypothetical protein
MKFENLAKGKNKYGYVITDDSGIQESRRRHRLERGIHGRGRFF